MRALIQRVSQAQVSVNDSICGKIGKGLLVLVGVHQDDEAAQTKWLADKVVNMRIFSDEQDRMNLSVKDVGGEVLVVSQFTLYANCAKGRRPDFLSAAKGEKAENLYQKFSQEIKEELGAVQTGLFGEYMQVTLINDGPVTIILDSLSP